MRRHTTRSTGNTAEGIKPYAKNNHSKGVAVEVNTSIQHFILTPQTSQNHSGNIDSDVY